MTALIVAASILALVPVIFFWPHIGILMWFWIGIMNPHRWIWGSLESLGYAQIIGMATLAAFAFSREKKHLPLTPVTVLVIVFMLWLTVTSVFAHLPGRVWGDWNQSFKIILMTMMTVVLINTRERLHALVWIVVVSLGYYGFKGGLFTVLTGGAYRVWGPDNSFIQSNNQLALALIMLMPLVMYLWSQTEHRVLRPGLLALGFLCAISVIGSQSRGAFLALCVMALFLVWKSRRRLVMGVAVSFSLLIAVMFVPDNWVERMESIQNYEQDQSAQSRFRAWTFAYKVALDYPITGGGFNVFLDEGYYLRLVPDATAARNMHSVYFEVLGEHGFIGLALFLGIMAAAWFTFGRVIRRTRKRPELAWAHDFSRMAQVSIIGYASAGAFLNLAFYDLYWLFVGMAVIVHQLVSRELAPESARRRRQAPAPVTNQGSAAIVSPKTPAT